MDTPPQRPDPSLLLPPSTYYQIVHTLRSLLPPPVDDTPDADAHRMQDAIGHVASMLPVNANEAKLAARCVAADAHAMLCMQLATAHRADLMAFAKCTAQSASMMRQADASRRLLMQLQTARRKLDADSSAAEQASWTEHCAAGYMMDVLTGERRTAPPEPPPALPPAEPRPSETEPQSTQPAVEPQDAEPQSDPLTEAEQYAVIYPRRAALIRRLGRLPDNPSFGPPDEALVHALIHGRTPTLLALDQDEAAADAV